MISLLESNLEKLYISKKEEVSQPDQASTGAYSRWLEGDGKRQRMVTYPKGYEADHICYAGHSFCMIEGEIKIMLGDEVTEWKEGDAFIIPDKVPHRVFNPFELDAKVVVTY